MELAHFRHPTCDGFEQRQGFPQGFVFVLFVRDRLRGENELVGFGADGVVGGIEGRAEIAQFGRDGVRRRVVVQIQRHQPGDQTRSNLEANGSSVL